jgi:isoquinoline 1-oxidoreductase beta subunit
MLKAGLDAPRRPSATRTATPRPRWPRAARIEAVYSYPHQNHATMEP